MNKQSPILNASDKNSLIKRIIGTFCISIWLNLLRNTDSYFFIYIILAIVSILSIWLVRKNKISVAPTLVFSIIFSLFVTLANYFVTEVSSNLNFYLLRTYLGLFVIFVTGVIVFWNLLTLIDPMIKKLSSSKNEINEKKCFYLTFIIIAMLYMFMLFTVYYPGTLNIDSIDQITQALTIIDSNHHPVIHTLLIRMCLSIGFLLFNDINGGVAVYSVLQIICMSLIIAYANTTICKLKINKLANIIFVLYFILVPHNYIYSFTMWKDVLFGGGVLLFIASLIRLFIGEKNIKITLVMILSSIIICTFRSNGLIAYIVILVLLWFFIRKNNRRLLIMLTSVVAAVLLIKYPIMNNLGIKSPDIVEHLSIPLQQVSRVFYDGKTVNDKDEETINKIINVKEIKDSYEPHSSDSIKEVIRNKGNQDYIANNKWEVIKAYISIGLQHPIEYLKGWVDETKGYFNGGYSYWVYTTGIIPNNLGIQQTINANLFTKIVHFYEDCCCILLFPFTSIGLHVWLLMACLYLGIIHKDKQIVLCISPIVAIWLTLLISTPVFCEFRYIYSLFTSFIIIVCFCIYRTRE